MTWPERPYKYLIPTQLCSHVPPPDSSQRAECFTSAHCLLFHTASSAHSTRDTLRTRTSYGISGGYKVEPSGFLQHRKCEKRENTQDVKDPREENEKLGRVRGGRHIVILLVSNRKGPCCRWHELVPQSYLLFLLESVW